MQIKWGEPEWLSGLPQGEWTLEVEALNWMWGNFKKRGREKAENSRCCKPLKSTTLLVVHAKESTLALQPSTMVSGQPQFWKWYFFLLVTWGKSLWITLLSASVNPLQQNKPGCKKQKIFASQNIHEDTSLGRESFIPGIILSTLWALIHH